MTLLRGCAVLAVMVACAGVARAEDDRVPRAVVSLINDNIQGQVRVAKMSFSLPNRITLQTLSLKDPDGGVVARADKVTARVDLAALALGELILSELDMQSPVLNVVLDKENRVNVLRALEPRKKADGPAAGLNLTIPEYGVTNGTLTFTSPDAVAVLSGAQADGSVQVSGTAFVVEANVNARQVTSTIAGISVAAHDLTAKRLKYSGRTLVMPEAGFTVGNAAPSTVNGRVVLPGKENLQLQGQLRLPPNYWPKGLGDAPFQTGMVDVAYVLTGPFPDPVANVKGTVGHVELSGYRMETLDVVAAVTRHGADATKVDGALAGGRVVAAGKYAFSDGATTARAELAGLALKDLTGSKDLQGRVGGKLDVAGTLRRGVTRLNLGLDGAFSGLKQGSIRARNDVNVKGRATWRGNVVRLLDVNMESRGARLATRGTYALDSKRLDLQVRFNVANLEQFVDGLPKNSLLKDAEARALVKGTTQRPTYTGAAHLNAVEGFGVPADHVLLVFTGDDGKLDFTQVKGRVAGGRLLGTVGFRFRAPKTGEGLWGRLQIRDADASRLQLDSQPLAGRVDANVSLGGTTAVPQVNLRARGRRLVVRGQPIKDLWLDGVLRNRGLTADTLRLQVAAGEVTAAGFYHLDEKRVDGTMTVRGVRLEDVRILHERGLQGVLDATVAGKGPLEAPAGKADIRVTSLGHAGASAGNATALLTSDGQVLVFDARVPGAKVEVTGTYGLTADTLVLNASVKDADLGLVTALIPGLPVTGGTASADVLSSGKRTDPDVRARVVLKRVVLPAERPGGERVDLGDAGMVFTHHAGELHAEGNVFDVLQFTADGPTAEGSRVAVRGMLEGAGLQRFSGALRRAEVALAAKGTVQLEVPARAPREVTGELRFTRVDLLLGEQQAAFANEGDVVLEVGHEALEVKHARVVGRDATVDVVGRLSVADVDLKAHGDVDLAVVPVFTREVIRGQGPVYVNARLRRKEGMPVQLEGNLTPESGALLHVRALANPLVFLSGSVTATLDEVRFNAIKAVSGEGDLELDGAVTLEDGDPRSFNVSGKAFSVAIPTSKGRITGGCDLTLTGLVAEPMLAGTVTISDGALRQRYELENFTVTSPSEAPSVPLHKRYPPLAALLLDVRVVADSVRARADLGPYLLDTTTRADFQVGGTLREPEVEGAVEVSYGRVRVGQSTFEIETATLDFPLHADRRLDPTLHLTARTVLPAERSPTQTEYPILLTLDGPLTRMVMDLKAVQDTDRVSRTELLSLALTGRPSAELVGVGGGTAGGDAALRLASSQAAGFLERRIEQEAQKFVDAPVEVRLELGAGSTRATARWEAFDRLAVEGSTDLGYAGGSQGFGLRGGARARLLLIDHTPLPFLETVAFEGNVTDVGVTRVDAQAVDLKLRLRFWEF